MKPPNPERELQKLQTWAIKYIKKVREERRTSKMSYKLIEAVKSIDYKDLAKRALWTFAQGFLAVALIGIEPIIDEVFTGNWDGAYALVLATGIGAVAAGLSALKTLIIGIVKELKEKS